MAIDHIGHYDFPEDKTKMMTTIHIAKEACSCGKYKLNIQSNHHTEWSIHRNNKNGVYGKFYI